MSVSDASNPPINASSSRKLIWAYLIHLGFNMWYDHNRPENKEFYKETCSCDDYSKWAIDYHPQLTCDKIIWDEVIRKIAASGMNMVIIDVGDGLKFLSHPEISVKGAWTHAQLKAEVRKMKRMGLEVIPKLNFSAGHKAWLGPYQKMISSPEYYTVCKNIIEEVVDIFENPRLFHIGMDEENANNQRDHQLIVVRNKNLWLHDFHFLVSILEKKNIRPWAWFDALHIDKDNEEDYKLFFRSLPKSVLYSNWYYGRAFTVNRRVQFYDDLNRYGFEQVPAGSNFYNVNENFQLTVDYCKKKINGELLKGFMMSPWHPTMPNCRQKLLDAADQVHAEMLKYS